MKKKLVFNSSRDVAGSKFIEEFHCRTPSENNKKMVIPRISVQFDRIHNTPRRGTESKHRHISNE